MKKILMPLLVIIGMGMGSVVYSVQNLERTDPAEAARQISPPNKYEKWLKEDVALIISEKERQVFTRLATDKERDTFIDAFWKQREGTRNVVAGKPGLGSMKMRVFEGMREGSAEPVKAVTSSYLSFTVSANIQAEADQAAQEAKIKQIFNLRGVSLLTEADLAWDAGKTDKAFHFFRLDDKSDKIYLVMVTPVSIAQKRFRIEVFEQNGGAKSNLLDTEFTLPQKNTAVFGFADRTGKPYFLSMQTLVWNAAEASAEIVVPAEGAVRVTGDLRPPKLIKEVSPAYPEIARLALVEGMVICEAQTDIYGRIQAVKILRSIPLLDQAAIDAVRQWIYEPMVIDGKPRAAIFTVTVRFTLK
jgi:TonB family protein